MSIYITKLLHRGKKLRGKEFLSAYLFADSEEELIEFTDKMEYNIDWSQFFPGGTRYFEILSRMQENCIDAGARLIGEEYLKVL